MWCGHVGDAVQAAVVCRGTAGVVPVAERADVAGHRLARRRQRRAVGAELRRTVAAAGERRSLLEAAGHLGVVAAGVPVLSATRNVALVHACY
jgi:hypothetical protein